MHTYVHTCKTAPWTPFHAIVFFLNFSSYIVDTHQRLIIYKISTMKSFTLVLFTTSFRARSSKLLTPSVRICRGKGFTVTAASLRKLNPQRVPLVGNKAPRLQGGKTGWRQEVTCRSAVFFWGQTANQSCRSSRTAQQEEGGGPCPRGNLGRTQRAPTPTPTPGGKQPSG